MENAIEIRGLSYVYPDGTQALKDLNADIPKGRRTVILGANGCGKSTLLRHMNGLLLPQTGSICVNGELLTRKTADSIRRSVGLLFDHPDNQIFSPSVEADVSFGPANLRMKPEEISARVEQAMKEVGILELRSRSPYNLSLGQKKRCAIAGVLAMQPDILLMDEPFSGLDPQSLKQFLSTLNALHERNMTQVISTHDVDIAYEWADHVIILSGGCVLAEGTPMLLQDGTLMEKACLVQPMLVRLFAGTDTMPENFAQARAIIKQEEGE